jgi:hypothetical protein
MRAMRWVILGLCGAVAGACRPQAPAPLRGDGQLVLELGGQSRSLAASLRALGVELRPPLQPEPAADRTPDRPPDGAPDGTPDRGPDRSSVPPRPADPPDPARDRPRAGPEPAPIEPRAEPQAWFEVELQPRQTLMDLAQQHLGTARRFQEIMALNGWDDRAARRLKIGQRVKIPRVERP